MGTSKRGAVAFVTHILPVWLYLTAVVIGGSAQSGVLPSIPLGPHGDKWLHFLVFGALYPLVFRAETFAHPGRTAARQATWSLVWIGVIGGALELYQSLLPHRRAEWGDWLADLAGAAVAALVTALAVRASRRGDRAL